MSEEKLDKYFSPEEKEDIKAEMEALKAAGPSGTKLILYGMQCYMNGMMDSMKGQKLTEETA